MYFTPKLLYTKLTTNFYTKRHYYAFKINSTKLSNNFKNSNPNNLIFKLEFNSNYSTINSNNFKNKTEEFEIKILSPEEAQILESKSIPFDKSLSGDVKFISSEEIITTKLTI